MFLEELIIEGFKSYATRTVVGPFDPQFNAITGLNGSGKSNILDALCFVLGLDNLRQVRASNMADLVYKRGQAGITKCSVTAVFNNEPSEKSPIGYVDQAKITVTRQIILGTNKQKFLINGHNVPQKSVDSLFQSVQLNVNNPHFLIMQGQITKVINMRPLDLLSLLEESAGTRMFEERRLKALHTMERKDGKVQEITSRLQELVEPKLAALRNQRTDFVEYKRAEAELEQLRKICLAYDFCQMLKLTDELRGTIQVTEGDLKDTQANIVNWKQQLTDCDEELEQMSRRFKRDKQQEEKLKKTEKELSALENECVRTQQKLQLETNLLKEKRKLLHQDDTQKRKNSKKSIENLDQERLKTKQFQSTFEQLRNKLLQQESLLQGLSTGISVNGGAVSYEQLLDQQQRTLIQQQTRLSKIQQEISSCQESIKSLKKQTETAKKHPIQLKIANLQRNLEKLTAELAPLSDQLNHHADQVNESEWRASGKRLTDMRERVQRLKASVNHLTNLDYQDPKGSLQGGKVRGIVANLIDRITDENCSLALEVVAGGKLFNVVVADEQAGKDLLNEGKLTKRITIIPLNKILPRIIPSDKIKKAQELTKGQAQVALSLVVSPEDVRPAMEFVFGGSFVCRDKESAQRVAFDPTIQVRAVTLEGDVYEPSGLLTGGSPAPSSGLLSKLFSYKNLVEEVIKEEERFHQLDQAMQFVNQLKGRQTDLQSQLDLGRHELKALEDSWGRDPVGRSIPELEKQITLLETLLHEQSELENTIRGLNQEINVLQGDLGKDRQTKLTDLKSKIESLRNQITPAESAYLVQQQRLDTLETNQREYRDEVENRQKYLNDLTEECKSLDTSIQSLQQILQTLELQCDTKRQEYQLLKDTYGKQDIHMQQLQDRRYVLEEAMDQANQRKTEMQSSLEGKRQYLHKNIQDLTTLQSKNPWIDDSRKEFGQSGTLFDWDAMDIEDARRRLQKCEQDFGNLRRTVNHNVMDMIDRTEQKENSLKGMLETVKGDKGKIERTLVKLDDYKLDALMRTWTQVNNDFGTILSELMSGSTGRLDPVASSSSDDDDCNDYAPEKILEKENKKIAQDLQNGLIIKVALGGVWKTGLTELSGGQRSLVALALVLALLRHKPAPLYILDEVDAALDLSHTQNIGSLLRAKFPGAQFIVVSLKEGMFANARVLFRTLVRDGISSVERIESTGHHDQSGGGGEDGKTIKEKKKVNTTSKLKNTIKVK